MTAVTAVSTILNLAMTLRRQGRLTDAERLCRQVLAVQPQHVSALSVLALLVCQDNRPNEAMDLSRQVLAHDPDNVAALMTLGHCAHQRDLPDQAAAAFAHVIRCRPDHVEAHFRLGETLQRQHDDAGAVEAYRKVLTLESGHVGALNNLGALLRGRSPEKVRLFRHIVAAKPDFPEAHFNLGNALFQMDCYDEAMASYDHALHLRPTYGDAYLNKGVTLRQLNHLDEAETQDRRALELMPGNPEAHFNLSQVLLLQGKFPEGWAEYEWRQQAGPAERHRPPFPQPRWNGEDPAGRTILLHLEQGLGDMIQMARYIPLVTRLNARVVVEIHPPLARLFQTIPGIAQVVAHGDPLPPFDLHLPLMSLPKLFTPSLDCIPHSIPYLSSDPRQVRYWRRHLGKDGPRVGVVWSGSPQHQVDYQRSMAAETLLPCLAQAGIPLFSLQKEVRPADRPCLERLDGKIVPLGRKLHDFAHTAAIMSALDLVISVDTSTAHLAGALGVPVWLLLPYSPDWRWLLGRDDSPWYPTMRLFRQQSPGDWAGVARRAADALAAWRP